MLGGAVVLIFCPLLLKTWRLQRLFGDSHDQLKRLSIPDSTLLTILLGCVLVDSVINIGLTTWNQVEGLTVPQPDGSAGVIFQCGVSGGGSMLTLNYVWKFLILLVSLYMALALRKVPSEFNESKQIMMAIFIVAFVAIIVVPVSVLVSGKRPPRTFVHCGAAR
jgi:hypothetical protein